jgi:hypothetical protein
MRRLDVVPFLFHFIGLRVSVAMGRYYTADPLNFRWRLQQWRHIRKMRYRSG